MRIHNKKLGKQTTWHVTTRRPKHSNAQQQISCITYLASINYLPGYTVFLHLAHGGFMLVIQFQINSSGVGLFFEKITMDRNLQPHASKVTTIFAPNTSLFAQSKSTSKLFYCIPSNAIFGILNFLFK